MGNRLSQIEEYEVDDPDPSLNYFRDIKTDRVQYMYEQLSFNRLSEFGLDSTTDSLSWKDYFRLLLEVADHGQKHAMAEARRSHHPAAHGLLLTPMEKQPLPEIPKKAIPDDYTEDEPSDDDDDDDVDDDNIVGDSKPSTPSAAPDQRITPNWDPAITNPIFFGVKTSSYEMYLNEIQADKDADMEEERQIVEKTFRIRQKALDEFEKTHCGRAAARQAKIDELVSAYNKAEEKRILEKEQNEKSLPQAGLRNFMKKWEKEKAAADKAYRAEVSAMQASHVAKTAEGDRELALMRVDIDAFQEAESQTTPSAQRLEDISREEMERGIADLELCRCACLCNCSFVWLSHEYVFVL